MPGLLASLITSLAAPARSAPSTSTLRYWPPAPRGRARRWIWRTSSTPAQSVSSAPHAGWPRVVMLPCPGRADVFGVEVCHA